MRASAPPRPTRSGSDEGHPAAPDHPGPEAPTWHALPPDEVLSALDGTSSGLSSAEAEARLRRHGPNLLEVAPPESGWRILLRQFRSVVVLLLVAASAVALTVGEGLEAAAIGVVLLINTVLGFTTELRARRSMQALLALESPRATVLRDGRETEVAASVLVPGDVLVVEAGQRVPADARLIGSTDLRTIEAALTGESLPVSKEPGAVAPAAPLAERANMLYLATHVAAGRARAVVVATGARTEVGRVGGLLSTIREEPTPLEQRLDALGRRLVWLAVGAGGLIALLGYLQGEPIGLVLETAIALAIAAVPEGLPAVATVALAVGVYRMAQRHALVRRLPSVETLGSVTVVCTDKTGTLTAGEMTVTELWVAGREYRVTGVGYPPEGEIRCGGDPADASSDPPLRLALLTGSLANRAQLVRTDDAWSIAGDPTEAALLTAARKGGVLPDRVRRELPEVGEVPFSSERKIMATFHRTADGPIAVLVKGAPEQVLKLCTRLLTADGEVPLTAGERDRVRLRNDAMAARALRVLALAYAPRVAQVGEAALSRLTFVGLVGMTDPPAAGVEETVRRFGEAGLRTVMITGDQRLTAVAVAHELGIAPAGGSGLDAAELEALSDGELAERAGVTNVYSRVSPADKLRIVSALRGRGEIVAMLGDGVNDAPALKRADIGVAMGRRGTDIAKAAAAVVLQDDRFATIGAAVEEGRVVFDNIRKFVFYLFSCNLAEVLVLVLAALAGMPLPLLPLQILWMNVVTDTFPALALAMEPADQDIMRRRPRDPQAAILSARFLAEIGFYAAMLTAATLLAFGLTLDGAGDHRAVSVAFMTLSLGQILHLGTARSPHPVTTHRAATSNRYALAAVAVTVLLQLVAVYLPPLARVLNLEPLTARDWMVVLPLAAAPAVVGQLLKALRDLRPSRYSPRSDPASPD